MTQEVPQPWYRAWRTLDEVRSTLGSEIATADGAADFLTAALEHRLMEYDVETCRYRYVAELPPELRILFSRDCLRYPHEPLPRILDASVIGYLASRP